MAPPIAATAVAAAVVPGLGGQASIAVAGGGSLSVTPTVSAGSSSSPAGASGTGSTKQYHISEDTLKLIDCVRARPALWHRKHLRQRVQVAHRGWEEIRKAFRATDVSSLKVRWKTLRDSFRREVKRMEDGELTTSSWPLFDRMSFLLGHFRTRECYLSPELGAKLGGGDVESWKFTDDAASQHNESAELTSQGESDDGDGMSSSRKRIKYLSVQRDNRAETSGHESDELAVVETYETVNAEAPPTDDNIEVVAVTSGNRDVIELPSHLFGEVTFKNKLRARIKTEPMEGEGGDRKPFGGGGFATDSDYNFLMSLHPFMQQLNTKRNLAVRIKMQQLIAEAMEDGE
uniref:Putative alcohol dehydrogenase transcription factor myb/sant-like protein n=1 Tax=Culex tarsalis TaxID=7177 RepID=A0A1Q3FDV1_CULTA